MSTSDYSRDRYLHQVTVGGAQPLTGPVVITEYDPAWPQRFAALAADIRAAVGSVAVNVEHVGSTSVPQLAAKPIIDIDLTVPDPAAENDYAPALERLGYQVCIREPDWHEHRVLKPADRSVNLHVFGPGAEPAVRNVVFRDWLRAHPQDRDLYADTKRKLAAQTWKYMQHYADAKTDVVRDILTRAGYQLPDE
jgi:GrpB-like predicted nucleotidyltransferase (UPF0157 family)